jgi:hypothetical protein
MKTPSDLSSRKLNILFLGGSNTMMKNGYSGETVKALGEYFDIGHVDNLAVGGSAIGMGLYTSLKLPNTYDIVFLAYSISDYSFVKSPVKITTWRWAFETLLKTLRQHNPEAHIYTLLFGRRSRQKGKSTVALFQETYEISERYGAHPINVDAYLHGLLPEGEPDVALYEDESHYARPVVSALAANYIARTVIATEHKLRREEHVLPAVPPPCRLGRAEHTLFSGIGETQHFKNSQHDTHAVGLRIDGPWQEITLPGELVQLNYISTKNSARILVAEEGQEPIAFDTLHKRVDSGEFRFLVRGLLFSWKNPPDGNSPPRKVALRAVADTDSNNADFRYIKQYHMMPPNTPEQNNAVYLLGALFS